MYFDYFVSETMSFSRFVPNDFSNDNFPFVHLNYGFALQTFKLFSRSIKFVFAKSDFLFFKTDTNECSWFVSFKLKNKQSFLFS